MRQKKGPVAEWLGRALQKLPQRFESARDLLRIRITSGDPYLFLSILTFSVDYQQFVNTLAFFLEITLWRFISFR